MNLSSENKISASNIFCSRRQRLKSVWTLQDFSFLCCILWHPLLVANNRILVISDLHAPYAHRDAINFLGSLQAKYKPDTVVNVGDEIDGHALCYHEHDPDLPGASDELERAIRQLRPLYRIFPKMLLCESNHGSLVYRRARTAGIPSRLIVPYRQALQAPRGWQWAANWTLKMPRGGLVRIQHSKGVNVLRVAQTLGMSVVQGHHHEKLDVQTWFNGIQLQFGMTVGCLVDNDALAFAYNKTNMLNPVLGCGLIERGIARALPMLLDSRGRWIGVTP